MFTEKNVISRTTSYTLILSCLNLFIYPCFGSPLTSPTWVAASSDAIPDNLCVIDLVHSVHTPCSAEITDASNFTSKLGLGLLLPEREGSTRLTCQHLIGATRTISGETSIKNLEPETRRIVNQQGMGVRLQYSDENGELSNTDYRLFFISKSSFRVLKCPEFLNDGMPYRLRLQPEETDLLFYDQDNPTLAKTGSRGTSASSDDFEALRDSLDQPERFFHYLDTPANSSDIEFCENLCPSGFQAVESLGVNGTGLCNRRNRAVEPFFNQSHFDYTFACTPCSNGYRYAFPLEKLTGHRGYEYQCQYPCQPFRACRTPFVTGIEGSAIHDSVCDCPPDNLRLVTRPSHSIDTRVVLENSTLVLQEAMPSERKHRYYQYESAEGETIDYDFLCATQSRFCEAYNPSGELQLGYQFTYDNAPSHCFIPLVNEATYRVHQGDPQNNIVTLEYRRKAPELATTTPAHVPDSSSMNNEPEPTEMLSFTQPRLPSSVALIYTSRSLPSSGSVPSTSAVIPLNSSHPVSTPPDKPVTSNVPLIIGGVAVAVALVAGSLVIGCLVGGLLCMKMRKHRMAAVSGTPGAGMVLNTIYDDGGNLYDTIGPGSQLTSDFIQATQQAIQEAIDQSPGLPETTSVHSDDTYTVMNPAGAGQFAIEQLTGN